MPRAAARAVARAYARGPGRRLLQKTATGLIVLSATIIMLAVPLRSVAMPVAEPVSDLAASLDSRLPSLMADFDVPGAAVGLVSEGEVVWSNFYGYAALQPSRPMRQDTLFRAESISKSVTAWGVLRLVDTDLVELDAPVDRYLPGDALPRLSGAGVTVRQLLNHTAGMPLGAIGNSYPPDAPRPSLLQDLQAEVAVENPPGRSFAYSNVGYNLLELVVEHVTGQDFAEYMDQEVLQPLGMTSSTYSWPVSRSDMLATGHRLSGAPVPPYVYPARASGGLHTTVEDVAQFVAASTARPKGSNPVLSAESIDLVHTVHVHDLGIYGAVADGYALGHFTEEAGDGRTALWHGGQGTGWMTHFHLVPQTGAGIVILTNSQRSWPLISAVLADWTTWSGTGSVQMCRITEMNAALRAALVFLTLGCAAATLALFVQVRSGIRRFGPLAADARPRRLIQSTVAVTSLAALAWAAAQPYLMVSSLFPSLVTPAALVVITAALLAISSAALPRQQRK